MHNKELILTVVAVSLQRRLAVWDCFLGRVGLMQAHVDRSERRSKREWLNLNLDRLINDVIKCNRNAYCIYVGTRATRNTRTRLGMVGVLSFFSRPLLRRGVGSCFLRMQLCFYRHMMADMVVRFTHRQLAFLGAYKPVALGLALSAITPVCRVPGLAPRLSQSSTTSGAGIMCRMIVTYSVDTQ